MRRREPRAANQLATFPFAIMAASVCAAAASKSCHVDVQTSVELSFGGAKDISELFLSTGGKSLLPVARGSAAGNGGAATQSGGLRLVRT